MIPSVSAAVSTVPQLPAISSGTGSSVETVSESEGAVTSSTLESAAVSDNRMMLIGVGAWLLFLLVAAVVVLLISRTKKNPPGGAPPNQKGKLGKDSPENAAYKERMLGDQHYRKY
jgi:hypothetical protein